MTEFDSLVFDQEKKGQPVDFGYLAKNEPKWITLAAFKGDVELSHRMRSFVMRLGLSYNQAERATLRHFLPALVEHRNTNVEHAKKWKSVEENLKAFYELIKKYTPLDFDAELLGITETMIWIVMDDEYENNNNYLDFALTEIVGQHAHMNNGDSSSGKKQRILTGLFITHYMNMFSINPQKSSNHSKLQEACIHRTNGIINLISAESKQGQEKNVSLKEMEIEVYKFWNLIGEIDF